MDDSIIAIDCNGSLDSKIEWAHGFQENKIMEWFEIDVPASLLVKSLDGSID